jgi:hypothetical protein
MFERFTDRARRVLMFAQVEARLLDHNYIGTEHVLLGLIKEDEGLAALALESLGISLEVVREQVIEAIGPLGQPSPPTASPPFTPRAKKVLELSLREARQLGHNYIGTEHILLGLVREKDGIAASVLQNLGVDLPDVRQKVIDLLTGSTGSQASLTSGSVARSGEWPRYPMKVIAGPRLRLGSDGVEFSVTGVLFFDESVQVFWQMSGIPKPIIELMRDPQLFSPNLQEARPVAYVTLSDDFDTRYPRASSRLEVRPDGHCAATSLFTPQVPDFATRLLILWQGEVLEIDV